MKYEVQDCRNIGEGLYRAEILQIPGKAARLFGSEPEKLICEGNGYDWELKTRTRVPESEMNTIVELLREEYSIIQNARASVM